MTQATEVNLNIDTPAATVDIPEVKIAKNTPAKVNFTKPEQVIPADLLFPIATLLGLYQMNGHDFRLEWDSEGNGVQQNGTFSERLSTEPAQAEPLKPYYQYSPAVLTDPNGKDFVALRVIDLNLAYAEEFPIHVGADDIAHAVETLMAQQEA